MKKNIQTVTIIGSGNIATWMAYQLVHKGIIVRQVYSKTYDNCQKLAQYCRATALQSLNEMDGSSDLYLFSLKDDAYEEVMGQITCRLPLAAMTSGSCSQRILSSIAERYGVVYPCQTISFNKDFSQIDHIFSGLEVPLCVEGCDAETTALLMEFAKQLSDTVGALSEQQRSTLHLAAVFASNFTNAMYATGFDILNDNEIDPKMLLPLLKNTLNKIEHFSPWDAQTGPAKRRDESIMNKHLAQLKDERQVEIYKLLSQYIMEKTNK